MSESRTAFIDCLSAMEQVAGLLKGITAYAPPLFSEVREFEGVEFDVLSDQGRAVAGIAYQNVVEAGRFLSLLEGDFHSDLPDWWLEVRGNVMIVACVARALMDPDFPPYVLDAYGLEEVHKRLAATKESLLAKQPALQELMKRPALAQEEVAHAP